ncbi:hypothetical protein LTR99_009063 [Exophiala xenobiotica]|uniref:Uncharacterized protein n=1 Tax=Vermiconidia calcicola TaxID=1690605 RepID=A0AAV9Q1U8_9PEZI|nr:hypothetical protein LTR96_009656 [Exophiala xenobiotica]KAK5532329.1 hypothetical protein LTR25_007862 [Vermiconidia calcicola]KAK5541867.1 hypothetical protein LTR23_005469 [Chaetothyriales sp. CCFEE 6169]KAK5295474.1 hypothetical protein LTR99_009063 [Exophiala xenobiotica]KAK5333702.1 hypothetical protein LTR98_010040 [Exophiala xenobiotica]
MGAGVKHASCFRHPQPSPFAQRLIQPAMDDEDDPVVASYNVYLTDAPVSNSNDPSSKLFVLQYPSHRRRSKPYNAALSQAPTSLRWKPDTGFLEVDVPILTNEYYNYNAAEKYGKAIKDSRTIQVGGSHGLAGGFNAGPVQSRMRDVPMHENSHSAAPLLGSQTLGGKLVAQSPRDPIYLVGCFHRDQLHLSHVDAVVQMRPQLHHIDAEDEITQKRLQANTPNARQKPGLETPAPKVESRAIEIKIKDNKEDNRDRSLNENARLLRDIQVDDWQHHEWVDQDDDDAEAAFSRLLHSRSGADNSPVKLRSSIGNGDWLDKMSAPREDGKKGLLAKLRGRERERARRKKAEEEKRQRLKEASGAAVDPSSTMLDVSSDSDLTTPGASDSEVEEDITMAGTQEVEPVTIKEEPTASDSLPMTTSSGPKKRGRPKKVQPLATGD